MARRRTNAVQFTRRPGDVSVPVRVVANSVSQGISQQPEYLRPEGQGTEQINGWSSPVEGLRKRQPSEWGGILCGDEPEVFAARFVVFGNERYLVLIVPFDGKSFLRVHRLNDLSVCDVAVHGAGLSTSNATYPDGNSAGWVVGDSTSYLANTEFLRGFAFINNGPLGLLVNRNKITAMANTTSPARTNGVLLFIQGVAFDVAYQVILNDVPIASVRTPRATDNDNTLSQSDVAAQLAGQLTGTPDYTVEVKEYIVYIERTDGAPIGDIRLDDGRGNTLGRAIGESTTTTADLPILAKDGFITKTRNEPGADIDDRWFKFTTFDGSTGISEGTWEETVKPGIPFELDEQTMPLVLRREADGVFFLGPADGSTQNATFNSVDYEYEFPDWGDRTAGDEDTVPDPPFIGNAIRDHTVFRSRYMVIAGNSVTFSEVDDIFNFFIDSTIQVEDTDAFDLQAQADQSTDLSWLVVVDEAVLVFSSDVQFSVRAAGDSDVLSARSSVILKVSAIEVNTNIRPKLSGGNVLFATNEFGFTNTRELQAFDSQQRRLGLNLGGSLNANLFTPKYIRGTGTWWDVGENLDYVAMLTDDDAKTMYIYKYLWQVNGTSVVKAQSSWSKWTFQTDVINLFFDENGLVLFVNTPEDGVQLLRIDAEELQLEDEPGILLDRRILEPERGLVTSSYDPINDVTTFTLPYTIKGTARAVVRQHSSLTQGILLGSATSGTDIVCSEKGDFTNSRVAFGEDYEFSYQFTKAFMPVRDSARNRVIGETTGRTTVHYWETQHFQSGFYEVVVDRAQRASGVYQFRPRTLGTGSMALDTNTALLDTGTFRVPVHTQNNLATVTVRSSNWLPVTITGAAWEGVYSNRSKRMS